MASLRTVGRVTSRVKAGQRLWGRRTLAAPMAHPGCVRHLYRGPFRRDPFTQMEEFMKDMERKFKRDIEDTMGSLFKNFPGRELPAVARSTQPGFGEMEDLSTSEKYKLNFHFPNAKPENIKVTLKGCTLRVSGEALAETETSKSSHEMSVEFNLPEDVELDALESSLSQEGLLVVEAPRNPVASPDAPKAIPINKE